MSLLNKVLLPSALALAVSHAVIADETDSPWSGAAELGSVWTAGNTDTQTVNGQVGVKHVGEQWTSQAKFSALGSSNKDRSVAGSKRETTAEKYNGLVQFDRHFTENLYATIVGQQERDRFSGFQYQGVASVGMGYHALKTDSQTLDLAAGPGYYRERVRETGDVNEQAIARLSLKYEWKISEGVSFIEDFAADVGDDNQVYRSETGLKSQLKGNLATKLTYKVKYVDEVPVGTKNADSEFSVALVYSF